MKQRPFKATPGLICIIFFSHCSDIPTRISYSVCIGVWSHHWVLLNGLDVFWERGLCGEWLLLGQGRGVGTREFQCQFRGKVASFEHSSKNLVDIVIKGSPLVMGVTLGSVKYIFLI